MPLDHAAGCVEDSRVLPRDCERMIPRPGEEHTLTIESMNLDPKLPVMNPGNTSPMRTSHGYLP